jgi:hypothetical protein
MARALSARERNVIIGGGIFLICFLAFYFVVAPKRKELKVLKSQVAAMREEDKEIDRIERLHELLKRETDPVRHRIEQRRKDFDLVGFVDKTQAELNFGRVRQIPQRPATYGNSEKHASTFVYDGKSLAEIAEYLKRIEEPDKVISIEDFLLTPKSPSDPSRLNLRIRLATVVPIGPD